MTPEERVTRVASIIITVPCPDFSTAADVALTIDGFLKALSQYVAISMRRGPEVFSERLYLEGVTRHAAHVRCDLSPGSGIREADMERYRGVGS